MRACCKKGPLLSGKFVRLRLRLRSRHPKFGGRFGRRAHLFMSICSLCKNFLHLFYFVMFILELRWWCYTFQPPFLCFCKKLLQLFLFMLWHIFLILNNAYYLWLWWVCICNFNLHGLLAHAFFCSSIPWQYVKSPQCLTTRASIDWLFNVCHLSMYLEFSSWEAYLWPWNGHKSQYSDFVESFIQEHVSQIF